VNYVEDLNTASIELLAFVSGALLPLLPKKKTLLPIERARCGEKSAATAQGAEVSAKEQVAGFCAFAIKRHPI